MGTWKKMDFWEQQELGKMDFGKHGKEWGMIRKKCMPLPNGSDSSMSVTLVLYSIPVSDSRISFPAIKVWYFPIAGILKQNFMP